MTMTDEETAAVLDASWAPPAEPDDSAEHRVVVLEREPRKCRRHVWGRGYSEQELPVVDGIATLPDGSTIRSDSQVVLLPTPIDKFICRRCGAVRDPIRAKRGKSSRRLGHDGERRSEKRYGWRKVGEYGGITDLEGTLAIVQQKTSRRAAPVAWKSIFAALEARSGGRVPLILLSFVKAGVPSEDFVIVRGKDWLALHGTDEPNQEETA
jgi:hypothetical protein